MHSLLMTDNNTVLMGGLQNYAVELDLNTVQETQKVSDYQSPQQSMHTALDHMATCVTIDQGYATKIQRGPVEENFLMQRSGTSQ